MIFTLWSAHTYKGYSLALCTSVQLRDIYFVDVTSKLCVEGISNFGYKFHEMHFIVVGKIICYAYWILTENMQTMHCITLLTVPRNFQCVTKVVNLAINCNLPNHKSFNATNVAFTPSHCYPLLHYIAVLQTNYILSMYGNLTVLNCHLPDYDIMVQASQQIIVTFPRRCSMSPKGECCSVWGI